MITFNNKNNIINDEIIFIMYFWGFTLFKPILRRFESYSTYILLLYVISILFFSYLNKIRLMSIKINRSFLVLLVVVFVFLSDFLIRPNDYINQYMYDFIIYGIIPIYLFSQISNYKKLLKYYSIVSLIMFILFFSDPFNGYTLFINYMSFGFDLVLPAYFGLYIGRRFFNYKWMFLFEVACFLEVVFFANRSAMLSAIIFFFIMEFFRMQKSKKVSRKKIMFIVLLILVFAIIGVIFIKEILENLVSLLETFGLNSYSITKIHKSLINKDLNILFSGRINIWKSALDMIKENILIGSGTGSFHSKYGYYTHNILLDTMVQYGIVGVFAITGLTINSFVNMKKHNYYSQILCLLLFTLWFPQLLLSSYMFHSLALWCFFAYAMLKPNYLLNET